MITTLTTRLAGPAKSLSWGRYRYVALVLLVAVVLTAIFFNMVQNQPQAHTQVMFKRQAETYQTAVQKGIERNLEVIESISGLYAASEMVERHEFRKFVQGPLSRHKEIRALEWIPRVTDSDRAAYEEAAHDWLPGFQFTERGLQDRMVRSRERAEYYPVYYVEPLNGNEAAVGFDLGSNPARLQALERARDTGEVVTTARITLVQETGQQFGFLIFQPIYRNGAPHETLEERRENLAGYALGVFRAGDMVEAALEDLPEGIVNIQLVDEASPADEGLLYPSQASDSDNPAPNTRLNEEQLKARGELYLREPLEIPGRQWSLLITSTAGLLGGPTAWEAWGVLAGGLLITALLVAHLINMINHGARTQRLAAELTTLNEGLKTEVAERKRAEEELKLLTASLERSNRELQDFASVASHDLQEPLRKVRAFGDLLKSGYGDTLAGQGQDYLQRIVAATERMQTLINDLLTLARVTIKAEPFVPVDLAAVAEGVLDDLEVSIQQAGGSVEVSGLPTIDAEPTQMRQLLQNLISNSLKFHKKGEPPVVKVRSEFLDGPDRNDGANPVGQKLVNLMVEDNGIGFDEKYLGRIFNVFQRLNGRAEFPGTGIGLAVCHRIVGRHCGAITAKSQPGQGSTFIVTLPLEQPKGDKAR